MSERSQGNLFENDVETLMQSSEAFHVRTSVLLALALASMATEADFGENSTDSFASYDQDLHSWKTWQRCLTGEWAEYSQTWPESGMTRNGQSFRRVQWVRHICDGACSLWPTPTASSGGRAFGISQTGKMRFRKSTVLRVRELVTQNGWRIHPNFTETLMGFPLDWTAVEP